MNDNTEGRAVGIQVYTTEGSHFEELYTLKFKIDILCIFNVKNKYFDFWQVAFFLSHELIILTESLCIMHSIRI